jgi:hypothetical protein
MTVALALLVLLQDPPPLKAEKRTLKEAVEAARKEVAAWSKEAGLLKATCRASLPGTCDPVAGRYGEIELLYATKEGCPPGELKTRVWSLGNDEPILRAGEPKTLKSGPGPLPAAPAEIKAAVASLRGRGMKYDPPLLELAALHGRAVWYTQNPRQDVWFADGATGEFLYFGNAEPQMYVRDQTIAVTSWKQAAEAILRELRGWKVEGAQVGSVRATGLPRKYLDPELGLVHWEFLIYAEKPAPAAIFYRVANGNVAWWAVESVPADRSHFAPLASWNLAEAGARMREHPALKPFLDGLPRLQTELTIDPPRMKAGEALFRLRDLDAQKTLEVTLDRKGAVKGPKK